MRNIAAALALSLALVGCASSSTNDTQTTATTKGNGQAVMQIQQLSRIAEAARNIEGGMPVKYRVRVANRGQDALTLKRIAVQSVGQGAYTLRPYSQTVNRKIEPDHYEDVEFTAPAVIEIATMYGANGPVTLRLTGYFESPHGSFEETQIEQVGDFSGNETGR